MSERDRIRWLGRASAVILVVGLVVLAARPLAGMRRDIAATRELMGDQVALSDQLVDNTAEASTRIGEQIELTEDANQLISSQVDLTREANRMIEQQLEATLETRDLAQQQAALVRRSIEIQEQLLAISRELLEETRRTRRCACAVAETTEPADQTQEASPAPAPEGGAAGNGSCRTM